MATPRPKLSDDLKQRIVEAWEQDPNVSYAALGERFSVKRQTVHNLIKRFKERGTVANAKATGRPPKTSERTDRLFVRESEKNSFKTPR